MLGVEPPGFGADVHDRGPRCVVDEDVGGGQFVGRLHQNGPFLFVDLPHAQTVAVDARLHGEQTLHHLLAAHLQAEDGHPGRVALGRVLGQAEGEAGFAHAGPPGQDDQIALLHAAQGLVQQGEARGHAHQVALVAGEEVDAVHHIPHHRADGHQLPVDAAFADAKDQLLGPIHHVIHIVAFVVGQLGDATGGVDQTAQDGRALDDAGVVVHIDGRGRAVDQLGDIGRAADLFQATAALQLVHQGDKVRRLPPLVEQQHGLVDPGVALPEKVLGAQEVGDLDDGVRVDEQRAQHRLLGLHVGRRRLQRSLAHRRSLSAIAKACIQAIVHHIIVHCGSVLLLWLARIGDWGLGTGDRGIGDRGVSPESQSLIPDP